MGNFSSTDHILDEETVTGYAELTYLRKSEIQYIIKLLDSVNPGKLSENIQHRFTIDEINSLLPQIRCSPFRDSIFRVFSSQRDNRLSLEDILDLCSAFSKHCPHNVRAAWAFYIFDFDGDNQISLDDLIEAVHKLTWTDQDEHESIDKAEAERIARMVFRHGDRTPCKEEIYPKLSYNPNYDTLGYGQLTEKGKIREFRLGAMLRQRYSTFFGRSHTYGSVYAYSTDVDRTKMSLQLVLAGIYPPTLTDTGRIELSPIPAFYEPLIVDNIMNAESCPRFKQEYNRIKKATPAIVTTVSKNEKLFKYIEENTGIDMTVDPIASTYGLYHFLTTQESMNITLPEWATEEVQIKMNPIVELEYQVRSYNNLMKQLNGGYLVQEFIKNMNAKANQTSPKIYVYSGHEVNIAAFAKAHDFTEPKIPSFGSAIIVEKLRDGTGKHFVQIYLWTGVTQELKPYKLSKCTEKCPYEKYITIMEHVIPLEGDINCSWNNVSLDQLHQYYSTTIEI